MDLQQHIKHYLDNNEFAKWNLLGLLQYLATIIIYTNEDVDDIILVFKDQLKLLSGLQNLTKKSILTDKTTAVVTSSEEFAKLKNLSGNPIEIGNEEGDDDQKENDMVILFNFIKTHTLIEFLGTVEPCYNEVWLIKAFSLGPSNPLLNITSIERLHLNSFVHPWLESTLWNVARVNYEFHQIHFHSNLKREYAYGIGRMAGPDKYQLVYVEGSKPDAKDEKKWRL
ncbi:8347_t:CDS:2 [Entrophospora sp. SA101]|nr:12360_t:CDS:2 [Entrophospora sp. SA101]CAJ0833107.1 8347_t:CDS:2 [Entrophospora sp. SA101]CAJ0921858.1 21043_t:CDS:2 [Entrophospora sp. SA101]